MMTVSRLASILLSGAAAAIAPASAAIAADYKIVQHIKVPDGAFDYAAFDAATGHVLMARTDFTTVIDVKTGRVSELASASNGHIALPVPGTTLLVVPQRQTQKGSRGTIRIVDAATDRDIADLPAGMNPDGASFDPFSRLVFVINKDSGDASLVNAPARKVVGTVPIGGSLEFSAPDGAGRVFVNVENSAEIAVIDVNKRAVTNHYKLKGCVNPSGLAYIPGAKLLIAPCENQVAKVLSTDNGEEVASLKIARRPDSVIYDPVRHVAFIPCGGDGILEVVSFVDRAHIAVAQHLPTLIGTRTGTVDPQTGRVYLMASRPDPSQPYDDPALPAPPGGRPPRLPGSYEVLVVGP